MPSARSSHAAHALQLTQDPDNDESRAYAEAVYTQGYRVTGNQRRFPIFRLPARKHFIKG